MPSIRIRLVKLYQGEKNLISKSYWNQEISGGIKTWDRIKWDWNLIIAKQIKDYSKKQIINWRVL